MYICRNVISNPPIIKINTKYMTKTGISALYTIKDDSIANHADTMKENFLLFILNNINTKLHLIIIKNNIKVFIFALSAIELNLNFQFSLY
jgi:hypothetical protein